MPSFHRKIIYIFSILILYHIYTTTKTIITIKDLQSISKNLSSIHSTISKAIYPANADGTIRILLYNGCSGSTATIDIIQSILNEHNFNILSLGDLELTKPHKNPYYDDIEKELLKSKKKTMINEKKIITKSLYKLNEEAFNMNKILLIKARYNEIDYIMNTKYLDVKITGIQRRNKLDRAICVAKDCFRNGTLGYPVLVNDSNNNSADTKKTGLCFNRRKYPNEKLKVHFNIYKLKKYIQMTVKDEDTDTKNTKGYMLPSIMQYYEDLFEFTHTNNETIFQSSINSWEILLKSIIPAIDKEIISDVLSPMRNTRKLPSLHGDSIVNYNDVSNALKKYGPSFETFLRE